MSLVFPKKKTTVLLGRSGTGKSAQEYSKKEWRRVRKNIGVSFQGSALFDSMNILENVAFPIREHSKMNSAEIIEKAMEKLEVVGLKEHVKKMPSELSGGMQKRAALARAIALDPDVVLFDEPTSGLDPIVTSVIDELVKKTQEKTECTFIIISHDMASTFRVADKVAMLYQGKILEEGTVEKFKNTTNPLVLQFIHGSLEGDFKI